MKTATTSRQTVEYVFLLLLVVVATFAFSWLIGSFIGAVLWGVIAAILFAPLNARLLRAMPQRHSLSAAITLLVIVTVAIIPAILLGATLLSQATATYARIQTGEIDLGRAFVEAERRLPEMARNWLTSLGLTDFAAVQARTSHAPSTSAGWKGRACTTTSRSAETCGATSSTAAPASRSACSRRTATAPPPTTSTRRPVRSRCSG